MTPKELYVSSRKAGYTKEQAVERVRQFQSTGKVPHDPTEAYWDALVKQESGGRQSAVSPKGAVGRAQVMPKTAPEAARMAGLEFNEDAWRNDPVYNEAIGRAYFRKQHEDFGDPRLAAAAYNAGPGAVRKAGGDISKLPAETRNYVPAVMGNKKMTPKEQFIQLRQQGYSKEEAAAMVRAKTGAAPKPQPAQQAPAQPQQQVPQPVPAAPVQAPAPVQQQAAPVQPQQPAEPTGLGAYLNRNIEDKFKQDTSVGRFGAGVVGSAANLATGAHQLYSQLTGDDEALRRLDADRQQRKEIFQKYDPEGSGISAADVGKVTSDVGTFGLMGGPKLMSQVGVGAAQGALEPADSVMDRVQNTAVGAGLGAIGPIISGARGMTKNMAPIDAAKDFTTRAMNQAPGAPVMEAYEDVAKGVGGAADDVYKKYASVLRGAEQAADLPPVKLSNTLASAADDLNLEDEVVRALSPKARTTISTVQSGAKRVSPILDEAGSPFEDVSQRSFEDVRATLRELKNVQASFKKANRPGAVGQIQRLRDAMEKDLDEWAATGTDVAKASLDAARGADVQYRDEVLPTKKLAENLRAPDGKSLESKIDSYLFGGVTSSGQAGTEVKKLVEAAPDVKGPLRKIMASKLNVPRGEVASARQYLGGTTAEAVLSKEEREYMIKLADALQKNPNFLSVKLPMVDKILKTAGIGSVKPYDYVPLTEGPISRKLMNALRASRVGALTEDE